MNLADYLRENCLSQADFARDIGASDASVSRWVRGLNVPHALMMHRIAQVTEEQVNPIDFFGFEERG